MKSTPAAYASTASRMYHLTCRPTLKAPYLPLSCTLITVQIYLSNVKTTKPPATNTPSSLTNCLPLRCRPTHMSNVSLHVIPGLPRLGLHLLIGAYIYQGAITAVLAGQGHQPPTHLPGPSPVSLPDLADLSDEPDTSHVM